ncbi:hypothetical protein BDR03DRAFT_949101 [Suillus americanus]|nr:hypothetical protein BDR03DRAFT_949101 [Suillus americanus]
MLSQLFNTFTATDCTISLYNPFLLLRISSLIVFGAVFFVSTLTFKYFVSSLSRT